MRWSSATANVTNFSGLSQGHRRHLHPVGGNWVKTEEKACPSLNLVETHSQVKGGQAMSFQHSIGQSETQGEPKGSEEQEGIVVPRFTKKLRNVETEIRL